MSHEDVTSAVVTVSTYTPPTSSANFEGYFIRDGLLGSVMCGSLQELITSDNHPFCCATRSHGDCYQPTTCSGNTMVDPDNDTWACDPGQTCRPMTIYQSYEGSQNAWSGTHFWCFQDWVPDTVYRTIPYTEYSTIPITTSSTTTTSAVAGTGPSLSTATQTSTSSPMETGPTSADSAASASSSPSSSSSSTNTGAIAGGVVGGVAGLALIVAVAFFIMRRKKTKGREMNEIGQEYAPRERDL